MTQLPKVTIASETSKRIEEIPSRYKSQLDRFKEAARELETDDDEERFNERLKKLTKQKPDEKSDD
jgi:hypothetical protein